MTVRANDVLKALVELWTPALAAVDVPGQDTVKAPVYNGPEAVDDSRYLGVWVGFDPTDDDSLAVSWQQEFTQHGGASRRKQETGAVNVAVIAWSGDNSTLGRREQVNAVIGVMESTLRDDADLGGLVIQTNFGGTGRFHQQLTADGNEVFAVVTVEYLARI